MSKFFFFFLMNFQGNVKGLFFFFFNVDFLKSINMIIFNYLVHKFHCLFINI